MVTTIIVGVSGFVEESNLGLVFVTLLLHTFATVAFCFMLVPLIRSSKLSSLYFLLFMLAPGIGLYMANVAAGFPPAWKKSEGGASFTWIGAHLGASQMWPSCIL